MAFAFTPASLTEKIRSFRIHREVHRPSVIIYSVVETAKENGLIPFIYLTYLFEILPNIDTKDINALDQLLPWSESLPESCRLNKN